MKKAIEMLAPASATATALAHDQFDALIKKPSERDWSMKRFLISIAALSVGCGASAQSTVNLFGVLDAGIAFGRGSIATKTQLVGSGFNSSRIGFRGVEDLGGGLSAGFWLEAGVANDDGQGAASNSNNQGSGAGAAAPGSQPLTFNRRSTVSLVSASLGELRLGRDFSPQFLTTVQYDPFGATGVGSNQLILGATSARGPWAANGGSGGPAIRSSNGISYLLPETSSGVFGMVQRYLGENTSGTPIAKDGTGSGIRLGWRGGAFEASVAYAKTQYATGDIKQSVVGLGYTIFGARLTAAYQRDSVASALPSGKGWLVGANVPLGSGQILASYSGYKTDAVTSPAANKLALGYIYLLSKRTAIYGIVARLKNEGTSAQSLNGSLTAAGKSSTGTTVGIRHAF
ncbi:porin [Variovorax sp. PBL-H6]|uniref:porin n=1 Tax=Variovorax sp. PBL-H6 TaxID=434009 RepID=UPI001E3C2F90|nr:porin [Variovorax sp. PBL-H6]